MEKKKFIIIFGAPSRRVKKDLYWIFDKEDYENDGMDADECAVNDGCNINGFHITERGREVLKSL